MPISRAPTRGRRTRRPRATSTSRSPPKTIRAAPTATGDAPGPIACAVPVVPKQMAARRTWRRAGIVYLLNNLLPTGSLSTAERRRARRPALRHSPVAAMPAARLTLVAARGARPARRARRADDDRPGQRARSASLRSRTPRRPEGQAQLVRAAAGQRARHASRAHEGAAAAPSTTRATSPTRIGSPGRFRGTTDEVIQWAAAKWGLAPDLVRAVAAKETWWRMSHVGDNGDSFGLFQVRRPLPLPRHAASAGSSATTPRSTPTTGARSSAPTTMAGRRG